MQNSTTQQPFVHFENLLQLIEFGVKEAQNPKEKVYKKDYAQLFRETMKNVERVFIPKGAKIFCVRYDETSPFIKFPYQPLVLSTYYSDNAWKKLINQGKMKAKLPEQHMFIQLDFEQPFLFKDQKGNVLDMVYGAGIFARNIVIDNQDRIALCYGLLHVSRNNNTKLDYDIMDSIHVLSITDKKVRIQRTDFNFKNLEDAKAATLTSFENHVLTRVVMTVLLKSGNQKNMFLEGVLDLSKKK